MSRFNLVTFPKSPGHKIASYTHTTQETTQDTLLDTQIIAEREVKLQ